MTVTIGILLFDGVEELDFAGPWEVFAAAAAGKPEELRVVTVAERHTPIRCNKGLRVLSDHAFDDAPALDVVLVPGGQGTRKEVDNPVLVGWLRRIGERCTWITSVCTGALLLHEAGFTAGRSITTHWAFVPALRERAKDATVLADVRYVQDGNVVTAAGVSAGIDMALWMVGRLFDPAYARSIQRYIQYDPAPPYAAQTQ